MDVYQKSLIDIEDTLIIKLLYFQPDGYLNSFSSQNQNVTNNRPDPRPPLSHQQHQHIPQHQMQVSQMHLQSGQVSFMERPVSGPSEMPGPSSISVPGGA